MSSSNYMKDERVRNYYEKWELNPFLTQQYKEYFYKFVKACLEVDESPTISALELALRDSFYETWDKEIYDEFCKEATILFEHLRDFYNTKFP